MVEGALNRENDAGIMLGQWWDHRAKMTTPAGATGRGAPDCTGSSRLGTRRTGTRLTHPLLHLTFTLPASSGQTSACQRPAWKADNVAENARPVAIPRRKTAAHPLLPTEKPRNRSLSASPETLLVRVMPAVPGCFCPFMSCTPLALLGPLVFRLVLIGYGASLAANADTADAMLPAVTDPAPRMRHTSSSQAEAHHAADLRAAEGQAAAPLARTSPPRPGTAASDTTAIDENGVLAEALATMLLTDIDQFRDSTGSHTHSAAEHFPAEPREAGEADTSGLPPGEQAKRPTLIGCQKHQQDLDADAPAGDAAARPLRFSQETRAVAPDTSHHDLKTSFDGAIFDGKHDDHTFTLLNTLADHKSGTDVIHLGESFEIAPPEGAGTTKSDTARIEAELHADAGVTLQAGKRLPFNVPLQQWQDNTGNLAQLILLPGNHATEARLCINLRLPDLKRLSCALWRLPPHWQAGTELKYLGLQVMEDTQNETGKEDRKIWQTSPDAPVLHPVTDAGISPVLLTELLISATTRDGKWDMANGYDAVHAYRATRVPTPEERSPPAGNLKAEDLAGNAPPEGNLKHAEGSVFGHQNRVRNLYLNESWSNDDSLPRVAIQAGMQVHADHDPHEGTLSLLSHAHVIIGNGTSAHTIALHAPERAFRAGDERIPFETPLQQWRDAANDMLSLRVTRDVDRDEILLCTDLQTGRFNRQSCSRWHVPLNWHATSDIIYRGIRIVDDHRASGGSLRIWETSPATWGHRR